MMLQYFRVLGPKAIALTTIPLSLNASISRKRYRRYFQSYY